MLRLFLLSLAFYLVCGTCARAQITHGTIDYLEHREFPLWDGMSLEQKKRMEEMKAQGAFDRKGRLTFNQDAFSYQQLEQENPPEGRRRWWGDQTENPDVYYTNMADSTVADQRRIMDRTFLMQDRWVVPEWEIPANQRANMAYTLPSKLAFAVSAEGDTLTAYFTESIPLGIGPHGYGGLPGAIVYLKVENEGMYTEYTLQTMQPNPADLQLARPTEGDAISREKFFEVAEKRREVMERRRRGWERRN
ncbi:GLPGLI family protein [Lewinella marina]|uniref:GLPGLI family protein n=1 Tax=Neolewinella marina TaxID=438751 RepID=A0A2G0CI54_9BACT|nr:GLPGLI family protein [Neolewinella marina]NJB85203.1 GLPGLI family protein [Neolewinella marina]PHK99664.1 hypothetical protein CGL56_01030 [Neolewinella marina]